MDKTPEYIKMASKAVEIQALNPPKERYATNYKDGDMICLRGKVFMYNSCSHSEGFIEPEVYDPKCVWLPRQDQLQAMIGSFNIYTDTKLFANWVRDCAYRQPVIWTSMQQLWLAYVMERNFNKTWNGEDWINES